MRLLERLRDFKPKQEPLKLERRKAGIRLKLVHRGVELRSMEEIRESLQEISLNAHEFWLRSKPKRKEEKKNTFIYFMLRNTKRKWVC